VKVNRPPGRSTRTPSPKNASGSGKCGTPKLLTTTSNVPAPNGKRVGLADLERDPRVLGRRPAHLFGGEVQAHDGGPAGSGGHRHHTRTGGDIEHGVRRAHRDGVQQRFDHLRDHGPQPAW